MSLLDTAMKKCTIMDKRTTQGPEGGIITEYVDGASFPAAIVFDSSMQARVAEKQGVKSLYTVTTKKDVVLQFHDTFRREEDGKIFRVTSDGDDKATPKGATINMRQVTAEEFVV